MIATIHQPQYLPWLGYFDKMDQADVFVLLDTVQFKKNEWQNRNRIKTAQGWQWITVPTLHRFPSLIREVQINAEVSWAHKHRQALCTHYGRAPYFQPHRDFFEATYSQRWENLVDLNVHVIRYLTTALGIKTPLVLASTLPTSEEPTERLLTICRSLGATAYLSGRDGGKYMRTSRFAEEGIDLLFQDFTHPVYAQLYGEFLPQLSAIDLLLNCGSASLSILRQGRKQRHL
ncbi:MAG: WbqC family protein [Deltaproteobacteria bacterium]|nr:WbqC family protein [Deltaproteobacteria bacterium]